jgi:hypothetical protein
MVIQALMVKVMMTGLGVRGRGGLCAAIGARHADPTSACVGRVSDIPARLREGSSLHIEKRGLSVEKSERRLAERGEDKSMSTKVALGAALLIALVAPLASAQAACELGDLAGRWRAYIIGVNAAGRSVVQECRVTANSEGKFQPDVCADRATTLEGTSARSRVPPSGSCAKGRDEGARDRRRPVSLARLIVGFPRFRCALATH